MRNSRDEVEVRVPLRELDRLSTVHTRPVEDNTDDVDLTFRALGKRNILNESVVAHEGADTGRSSRR